MVGVQRAFKGQRYAGQGRLVKDSFDTIQSTFHGLGVVDVSLNELDLIGNFIEVFAMAGA
jgi:hypothetical protein